MKTIRTALVFVENGAVCLDDKTRHMFTCNTP